MNMSSRNVESSSVGTTPQPTEKQLRDAIALILRSLQRGPSALIELPDFKQLVAIVANVPSSQATPSCVECGQCGEMFVNANDHDKHVREAHFAIPKGNLCNICQKYFNTAANLHLHRTQEHSALSSIKFCPFCHLEVLESIHTHNKEHHPNACLACKTDFQSAQERALVSHRHQPTPSIPQSMTQHDGAVHKRKFTCHTCWRTFTEKTHLTQVFPRSSSAV
ncbi:hypothetical protein SISSUDRAFT_354684 [Sistotremastrum suecicum HHB10207 ss-3]|uniref:C2H2-type domain-containing protein n=1 Tax=Sistotremastrum suecicum HHB10207 ss-3 TaxID=1314776 RepID=A0A166G4K2_9AGAM|nr:hypothetical protein SISSUDRAFT_354684 [Sistotremastrum suecicum HHB10207 ss-3]